MFPQEHSGTLLSRYLKTFQNGQPEVNVQSPIFQSRATKLNLSSRRISNNSAGCARQKGKWLAIFEDSYPCPGS